MLIFFLIYTFFYARPHPGKTRTINIEKSAHPVGFNIEPGAAGGVFVSQVTDNSLAAASGLVIGDQILEVCLFHL